MQINYNVIKISALLFVVIFLFAFSNQRNKNRKIYGEPEIRFLGKNTLFITDKAVSKLLIQNQRHVTNQSKDIIDLNALELSLNSNLLIKKAEVFMSVNGKLSVEIEQKRPIARVNTNTPYYIAEQGNYMPLSPNYSARVPLVTGQIHKKDLSTVFEFAKAVDTDEFLKKHVIEIHQNKDKTIDFRVRKSDFKVHLGNLKQLQKKINNFKVFYQKALKDNMLNHYKLVNLKFDKQVICTKK